MRQALVLTAALSLVLADRAVAQLGATSVSGGVTVVGQATNDERVLGEVVGSFDLFFEVSLGPALLHAYVEANTTPRSGGVSTLIARVNSDAGTALNRRGRGRVQLSEIRFVAPVANDLRVHAGVLDATGFLDVSRIANDENLFFLGLPFVNNPTIEFPDYAPGVAVEGALTGDGALRIGMAVTSSNGLADNPDFSYAQLLDVDAPGKGVFSGASLRWQGDRRRASVGAWVRSNSSDLLDGSGRSGRPVGVFTVIGSQWGDHSLAFRGGLANGDVSIARAFGGATYLWNRRPDVIGVGVGRSFRSSLRPDLDDIVQLETFFRRRLVREAFATLSLQRVENAGFDGTGATVTSGIWVAGVRLSMQF